MLGRPPGRYENTEPWENTVPADLIPAVKHLRDKFNEAHLGFGWTSKRYCYATLHNEVIDDPSKEYYNYLMHMKSRVGAAATQQFHDLLKQGTSPAIFKAFFDLYMHGVTIQAVLIFEDLKEIGRANQKRLATNYLEWAESQTNHLIRSEIHKVAIWVRDVCDVQGYDPQQGLEEHVYWRNWQAPMFLIMKPLKYQTYYAATAWTRNDPETSSGWLQHFAEYYVLHLEIRVHEAAGAAALELAKNPAPVDAVPESSPLIPNAGPTIAIDRPIIPSARREVRMADSQARYKRWQKKYRELKKDRPEMSDVWFSQQIARLGIAEGHSPNTIRKHMTK